MDARELATHSIRPPVDPAARRHGGRPGSHQLHAAGRRVGDHGVGAVLDDDGALSIGAGGQQHRRGHTHGGQHDRRPTLPPDL